MSDHSMHISDDALDTHSHEEEATIDISALSTLISDTFEVVYREYSAWNEEYCRESLESLRRPLVHPTSNKSQASTPTSSSTPISFTEEGTLIPPHYIRQPTKSRASSSAKLSPSNSHEDMDPPTSSISPSSSTRISKPSFNHENTLRFSRGAPQTLASSSSDPPPKSAPEDSSDSEFIIEEFLPGSDGRPISTITVRATTVKVPHVTPHPQYEMTTPLMNNVMVGDDSHYLPFVPYADDPEFMKDHFDGYQSRFMWFEWNDIRERDPDIEMVVLETAGRLLSPDFDLPPSIGRPLTPEDIDATGVLPLRLLPLADDKYLSPGSAGVLKNSYRRDFPPWPPNPTPIQVKSNVPTNMKDTIESMSKLFCHNRNCLTGFCALHVNEMPLPNPVPPTLSTEVILRSIEKECSSECCLRGTAAARSIPTVWTENDLQMLELLLKHDPDSLPCDLAVICRKPCYEVQKYREQRFPPTTSSGRGTKRNASTRSGNYHDYDSREYMPNDPCSHTGACSPAFNCQCYQNASHCSSACRCPKTCPRRLYCRCTKSKKDGLACTSDKCACMQAKRECDPELCTRCSCRDNEQNICRNVQLQRGVKKRTEVRPSQWGLGLFILEPARKGDLMSEYVGEVICDSTMISRNDIYRYTGRCYLFELNKTFTIDSATAGNETRYLNHSKNPNCEAAVIMVNGEHRIGLYASKSIEPGTELLFDYGDVFFVSEDTSSQSQSQSQSQPLTLREKGEIVQKGRKKRSKPKAVRQIEPLTDSQFNFRDRSSDEDYKTENKEDTD